MEASVGESRGRRSHVAEYAAALLTGCGFVLLLLLMLSLGLRRGVNHDESQHLAAGAVFGRQLLLPYRDFPYFHMPDLVMMYGVLFRCCGSLLLAARVLSVLAGWGTCLLTWWLVRRECAESTTGARWFVPAGAVALLFSNPIFREAFWRTWNHALATLFGLVGLALAMWARRRGWRWFGVGVFIGLAIGTRLTFAPLVAPLGLAALLEPQGGDWRQRARRAACFCGGVIVAMLPSIYLFAVAPRQFLFGNFTFNSRYNLLFRQLNHDPRAALNVKLLFPFTTLLKDQSNLVLAVVFGVFLIGALARFTRASGDAKYRLLLVLGMVPFALVGTLAPIVAQQEYYYALIPLMVLIIGMGAGALWPVAGGRGRWACALVLLAAAGFTTERTWHEYQRLAVLRRPESWPPVMFHEAGVEAAGLVRGGRVLTLEPLYALEGGLEIYPELVTGGLAWRAAPLLPEADRGRFKMMGPVNFEAEMERLPPAAVLTVKSAILDPSLVAWARSHGYVAHVLQGRGKLVDQATVWVRP